MDIERDSSTRWWQLTVVVAVSVLRLFVSKADAKQTHVVIHTSPGPIIS